MNPLQFKTKLRVEEYQAKIGGAHYHIVGEDGGENGELAYCLWIQDATNFVRAVNEHSALLAVAKAAERYLHAGDSVDKHGDKLEKALARLREVQS